MVTRAVNQSVSRSRTIAKCFARNLQLETARCGRKVEGYSRFTISVFRAVGSTVYRQTEVRLPSVRSTSVPRVVSAIQEHALAAQSPEGPRKRLVSLDPDEVREAGSNPPTRQHRRSSPIYKGAELCKGGVPPLQRPPCIRQFQLTPPPPHSTCTNDSAAPHYEHEDIRQAHRRVSGRTVCVCGLCDWVKGEGTALGR